MPMEEQGLTDRAVMNAHDMIHHAEMEEHEHEAALRRGISDEAAEAEYDLIHGAEMRAEQAEKRRSGSFSKLKKTIEKMMAGRH
ncbi:hypothetical protein GGS23DRAFT_120787 [Durotheca rogersii]|uniref:uncharacterized protein n=1 Tax=Durotheca rogersii TaxID=419775 RepID=UPI002220E371|nr:uncharacterized protein GGS23DRAFT_120787 [Durotheca rogersii]KAI5861962.1 hypothetical protein GGS23DRAFT_120787 [Durotheca rogersii]